MKKQPSILSFIFVRKVVSLVIVFQVLCFVSLYGNTLPFPFAILPQPQQIVYHHSNGIPPGRLQYVACKGQFTIPVMGPNLEKLKIDNEKVTGALVLIIDKANAAFASDEGYQLHITSHTITITAKSAAGLFYGCQSLEQLLEDAYAFNKVLPSCTITDYPAMNYRAVHFDVKHHLDHINYYYQSIDRLAKYKINAVVFEFEDKLRYRRQPVVGAPHAISIEEMSALTQYARKRNIEITPLVQGLGHASFILKHDVYQPLRELPWNHWAFCPLEEGTYNVLFDLYEDAMDATPGSKYLHIGGDEIGNIGLCSRCKPTADKEGLMSLNLHWLKRVSAFAKQHNRIPIFWDDMPLHFAGLYETTWNDEMDKKQSDVLWKQRVPALDSLLEDLPGNCVYMRWNYSMATQPGNIAALNWYQQHRLQAMIATATNAEGGMLFQADDREQVAASSGVISIRNFIQLAVKKNISGVLCTAWDDRSPHMENFWRGFIAAAEYSWHPFGRSLQAYDAAWLQREFGLRIPNYVALHSQLRKGSVLWYQLLFKKGNQFDDDNMLQSTKQVEHWLPPLEGRENLKVDYSAKLIQLPTPGSPGEWTARYKDKLNQCAAEINSYPNLLNQLQVIRNNAVRNKYYWELLIGLYKFQTTMPALMLAVEQCDKADAGERKKGIGMVKDALINFDAAWLQLQEIYSQTRFIKYPADFIPDRYFHLASQREDLTWMIQAQELFKAMIEEWLPHINAAH